MAAVLDNTITFKRLRNGEWGIQGLWLEPGEKVTVTRRDGSTTRVTVGRVLFTGEDGYSIATIATEPKSVPVRRRQATFECQECGDRVRPGTQCWETGLIH